MIRISLLRGWLLITPLALTACATTPPPTCNAPTLGNIVYVTEQGWHAELGIPVSELGKDLKFLRKTFKGAKVIMVGYGKKTFFTAPPDSLSEYILGPVPGPAVVHLVGLTVTPVEAYPPGSTTILTLPKGGAKALSEFIWKEMAKDASGKINMTARSTEPDGLFYDAESEYNLFHTCNTWTVEALKSAGLPVDSDGITFSGQAMSEINAAAAKQCE